jgi:CHAT domain-containing protein
MSDSIFCSFLARLVAVTISSLRQIPNYFNALQTAECGVHIATHGYVDDKEPQFSSLVLSLVDAKGNPQGGILRLYEIFNLRLAADLVVLSACETGIGKDIRGEGLVSLVRGFMYAGSKRVVASLWNVNDESTSTLMSDFYRGMLQEKLPASSALRAAQLLSWERNPDPRLWAAFTLQGEWRP